MFPDDGAGFEHLQATLVKLVEIKQVVSLLLSNCSKSIRKMD
jgi:hypothetical protein